MENGAPVLKDLPIVKKFSDLPVLAFVKITSALALAKRLKKYNANPNLNNLISNYCVKMGFGLH